MYKKFFAGFLAVNLVFAGLVWAHSTGRLKSVPFTDGSTVMGEVGYAGNNAGGSQYSFFFANSGDGLYLGTTNSAVTRILINNGLVQDYRTDGAIITYSDNVNKREGHNLSKTLTDNTATNIIALGTSSGSSSAVSIRYGVRVTDGTDYQIVTGTVVCRAVNKAGTVTASCTDTALL